MPRFQVRIKEQQMFFLKKLPSHTMKGRPNCILPCPNFCWSRWTAFLRLLGHNQPKIFNIQNVIMYKIKEERKKTNKTNPKKTHNKTKHALPILCIKQCIPHAVVFRCAGGWLWYDAKVIRRTKAKQLPHRYRFVALPFGRLVRIGRVRLCLMTSFGNFTST